MRRMIIIGTVFLNLSAGAQSLEEYLVIAADSNAALKASFLEYQAALAEVDQVGVLPDPELSFGYFISPIETRLGPQNARISLMQMFPWFGTLSAKEEAKALIAKAKYEMFEQARDELYRSVRTTYYDLFRLENSIRITNDHIDILKTFEVLALSRFESGEASMVDVLLVQLEIAELENKLLYQQDSRLPLLSLFNQYLNRSPDIPVVVPVSLSVPALEYDRSSVLDTALTNNDMLESFSFRKDAASASLIVAEKISAPSFGIGLNYFMVSERTDMDPMNNGNDALMPMVSLKLPIYRRKYDALVLEADIQIKVIENLEAEFINTLETSLENAWLDIIDADRRTELYQAQQVIAEQALAILLESYGANGSDFEEVLRIQLLILKYELELIDAIADKNTAIAKIESLM